VGRVSLDGLAGREYLDKTRENAMVVQAEPSLRLSAETDRVYLGARAPLLLRDGAHALAIATTGFPDVVVWNPWEGAETRWPQFGPGDYRRMVCVEAAVVGTPVSLEKGQRWSGSQILTVA
jgi:glucose-6-phosphate 1-epimerase